MAEEMIKNSGQEAPEKKAEKKTKKTKKPGFFKKIGSFFREYRSEMKKVVWYPRHHVIRDTGIVVAALAVCGLIIGLLDLLFTELILLLGQIG